MVSTRQIDPLADGLLLRIGRRENAEQKGRRYIIEGRLRVTWVDQTRIEATCRGSDATYRLGHDSAGPYCTCPASRDEVQCDEVTAGSL